MGELLLRGGLMSRIPLKPFAVEFDARIDDFAADIVSYWKFDETGATVTDQYGTQNATVTGNPERNVETIVDFDSIAEGAPADGKCIAWPGTAGEYAEAAHNAAHKTAQGTVVIYFQPDTLNIKGHLFAMAAASVAGSLWAFINTNGAPQANLRNAAGTPISLVGDAGIVKANMAYCMIIRWGSPSFSMSIWDADGNLLQRVTDTGLTTGTGGASAIRFGAWHTDVDHFDGPFGRVVWMNRRITDSEESQLALARTIVRGATDAYVGTVNNVAGIIAHWRFNSVTTFPDRLNNFNGTWQAAPSALVAELAGDITASDGLAVNLGGTGWASVADAPGLRLATGTIAGLFQATAAAIAAENYICAKFGSGNNDGDWGIRLFSDGRLRLFLQDGATQREIDTFPGFIQAGQKYWVAFRWSSVAAELIIDGRIIGRVKGFFTNGWTNNVNNLQFGFRFTTGDISNIQMDEWVLANRWINLDEIYALSEWIGGLGYTTAETTEVVNSVAAIQTAMQNATPGHHILVAAGTYNGVAPGALPSGARRRPWVLRPQTPGTVTFTNHNISLNGCKWAVVSGITFQSGTLLVTGEQGWYNRVTRCTFNTINDNHALENQAALGRFDHNDLSDLDADFELIRMRVIRTYANTSSCRYALIDHNYLHDTVNTGGGQSEALALAAQPQDTVENTSMLIVRNLFARTYGEGEVITNKCRSNTFIGNTHDEQNAQGNFSYVRHGGNGWYESEWVDRLGSGPPTATTGRSATFYNVDNVIRGMRLVDSWIKLTAGDIDADTFNAAGGLPPGGENRPSAKRNLVMGITGNAGTGVRVGFDDGNAAVDVTDTVIYDCAVTVSIDGTWSSNTTNNSGQAAPMPITAPVKLTPADVGIAAVDPLVPAGYS